MTASINAGGEIARNSGDYFPHEPVLFQEILAALTPVSGRHYLDCTLGAGGHAEGILKASAPDGRLLGLDLDPEALDIARQRLSAFQERVLIHQASYVEADQILKKIGWDSVDGIILDLGVSSMQIDRAERGFSFQADGPLDMRFNPNQGPSAADLVNQLSEKELAQILWEFGEERHARRIAKMLVETRPYQRTTPLAEAIKRTVPGYQKNIDPATRTFQALRIAVNRELETITRALPKLVSCLSPKGRIAVISFHSLEDRIVKHFFRREQKDCICPPEQPICTCEHMARLTVLTKKPLRPKEEEIARNPRSRSAKLRIAEKKPMA